MHIYIYIYIYIYRMYVSCFYSSDKAQLHEPKFRGGAHSKEVLI